LQYFQVNSPETFRVNVGSSAEAKVHRTSTADIQSPLSASSSLLIFTHRLWCQPITCCAPEVGQAVIWLYALEISREAAKGAKCH
jgi:hypothetical protein